MRTTLNIDDEAMAKLRKYAEERHISLGDAASDLIQRGAEASARIPLKTERHLGDPRTCRQGAPPLTN
jgi:hypothetical protein